MCVGALTKVDHVLGPEGGVTEETHGAVGMRRWVETGLQNVPQLVGDLE